MRDCKLYLEDILEAVEKIEEYTKSLTRIKFYQNSLVIDGVVRNLEIIGEAAKHIPAPVKRKISGIEWKKIVGLRNILIHEYYGVDTEIIWDIMKEKLPDLKYQIKQYLKHVSDNSPA